MFKGAYRESKPRFPELTLESTPGCKLEQDAILLSDIGCMPQRHKAQRSPLHTYASLKNTTSHVETLKPQIVIAEVQTHHRNAVTTHKHHSHHRSLLRARHRHSLHRRHYASRYPIANLNCGDYLPTRANLAASMVGEHTCTAEMRLDK